MDLGYQPHGWHPRGTAGAARIRELMVAARVSVTIPRCIPCRGTGFRWALGARGEVATVRRVRCVACRGTGLLPGRPPDPP